LSTQAPANPNNSKRAGGNPTAIAWQSTLRFPVYCRKQTIGLSSVLEGQARLCEPYRRLGRVPSSLHRQWLRNARRWVKIWGL